MAKHDRLAEGRFTIHEDGKDPCGECWRPPAAHIDLGDGERVVARTHWCSEDPVDFSHGYQTRSPELKRMIDVIRTCTAHANFHLHRTNRFTGPRDYVDSRYILDTREDLLRAYDESTRTLVPHVDEWKKQWSQKRPQKSGRR